MAALPQPFDCLILGATAAIDNKVDNPASSTAFKIRPDSLAKINSKAAPASVTKLVASRQFIIRHTKKLVRYVAHASRNGHV